MNRKHYFLIMVLACVGMLAFLAFYPQPVYYSVRFWQGEELLSEQSVAEGTLPEEVTPGDISGARFLDWDQPIVEAAGEQDYYAVYLPVLENHVPFLFAEDNLLHPEEPFTQEDLRDALNVLASDAAKEWFPELPHGDGAITVCALREILSGFWPETVETIFAPYENDSVMTRKDAAEVFCTLLGRTEEHVKPAGNAHGFLDLLPEQDGYGVLMEAAVPHEPGQQAWEHIFLPTGMESGWHMEAGRARFYDEKGYPVKDTVLENGAAFDAQGYFTSGSAELDELVTNQLAVFQEEDPEAGRYELLRYAYNYTRDNFTYLRRELIKFGHTGWETEVALEMFEKGMGNCYSFAAVFWAFARQLGYDATALSGLVGGSDNNMFQHSWVKIVLDGVEYYYDPELEMSRDPAIREDMFQMEKIHAIGIWKYVEP